MSTTIIPINISLRSSRSRFTSLRLNTNTNSAISSSNFNFCSSSYPSRRNLSVNPESPRTTTKLKSEPKWKSEEKPKLQEPQKPPPRPPPPKLAKLLEELKEWRPIYHFKYVKTARLIQRLKIYQTGFTCFGILPLSLTLTQMGQVEPKIAVYALGGSIVACVMLYLMGNVSSRTIGSIYVHKSDPNRINLARLTFFGGRQDTQLHAQSFVRLSELEFSPTDVYISLQLADSELKKELGKLYLSLKHGEILDMEAFQRIFGKFDLD